MDNKYSPTFAVLMEIAESLSNTINELDEVYNDAISEMEAIWKKIKS
jgi:hypothetical protein